MVNRIQGNIWNMRVVLWFCIYASVGVSYVLFVSIITSFNVICMDTKLEMLLTYVHANSILNLILYLDLFLAQNSACSLWIFCHCPMNFNGELLMSFFFKICNLTKLKKFRKPKCICNKILKFELSEIPHLIFSSAGNITQWPIFSSPPKS